MQGVLEYQGQIRFSSLPWEISERLAQFRGNWLEFVPKTNAIMFRQAQPEGCPALTGVACELITLIDSVPPEFREAMPGGELELRDSSGPALRLKVAQGEVRINWPRTSCFREAPDSSGSILEEAGTGERPVKGWARFAGAPGKSREIQALLDRFGGLYPEEEMPSECAQNMAYIRFRDVRVDPQELIARLADIADPPESLQAYLKIGTREAGAADEELVIQIVNGCVETYKPILQR